MTKTNEAAQPQDKPATVQLKMVKRDIIDVVAARVNKLTDSGQLHLPENYSPGNALTSWWLILQGTKDKAGNFALNVCSPDSIANATLDMIVQGLNPAKEQCYPVVYGRQLVCLRSYFGDEALLKRIYPGADVFAEVIYKGDEIEYEIIRGRKMVTRHKQKMEHVGGLDKIVGAYAIAELGEGLEPHCEIMTLEQIQAAWSRGENWPAKEGKMSAHRDHPEEFTRKTVISRACKRLINRSDDSYLVTAIKRQAELVDEIRVEAEVEQFANGPLIDLEAPAQEQGAAASEPEPEPAAPEGLSEEEKAEIEAAEAEPEDPPAARFQKLVDHLGLDPTKAKRAAADSLGLDDLRRLGSAEYESILADPEPFLDRYRKAGGKVTEPKAAAGASQGTLGGPDW